MVIKFIETESKMGGGGNRELVFNRYTVSFWKDEEVLGRYGGNRCTTV